MLITNVIQKYGNYGTRSARPGVLQEICCCICGGTCTDGLHRLSTSPSTGGGISNTFVGEITQYEQSEIDG